jgi:hypothetical protein
MPVQGAAPRFAFARRWREAGAASRGAAPGWTIAVVLDAAVDPLTVDADDFVITTADGRRLLAARAQLSAAPWPLAPWLVLLEGVPLTDLAAARAGPEPEADSMMVQVTLVGALAAADGRLFARDPVDVAAAAAPPRLALVAALKPTPICANPVWLLAAEPSRWAHAVAGDAATPAPALAAAAARSSAERPIGVVPLAGGAATGAADGLVVLACAEAPVVPGGLAEIVASGLVSGDGAAFAREFVPVLDGRDGDGR